VLISKETPKAAAGASFLATPMVPTPQGGVDDNAWASTASGHVAAAPAASYSTGTAEDDKQEEENSAEVASRLAEAAREAKMIICLEDVSRFTNAEMENTLEQIAKSLRQDEVLVFHFTNKGSARLITAESSLGFRASEVGQAGGGFFVVIVGPHAMGWEPNQGGNFLVQTALIFLQQLSR
jgi:hypothetical protein